MTSLLDNIAETLIERESALIRFVGGDEKHAAYFQCDLCETWAGQNETPFPHAHWCPVALAKRWKASQ
jgi:hypothetical protein